MSTPDDFEAYQRGYEDAMIAAGQGATTARASTKATARASGRDIGGRVGRGVGFAFGWLILFPLFMGLLGGGIAFILDGDVTAAAVATGGLAFLFAVFAGMAIVGWKLFINFWPLVIVVLVVYLIIKRLI